MAHAPFSLGICLRQRRRSAPSAAGYQCPSGHANVSHVRLGCQIACRSIKTSRFLVFLRRHRRFDAEVGGDHRRFGGLPSLRERGR